MATTPNTAEALLNQVPPIHLKTAFLSQDLFSFTRFFDDAWRKAKPCFCPLVSSYSLNYLGTRSPCCAHWWRLHHGHPQVLILKMIVTLYLKIPTTDKFTGEKSLESYISRQGANVSLAMLSSNPWFHSPLHTYVVNQCRWVFTFQKLSLANFLIW